MVPILLRLGLEAPPKTQQELETRERPPLLPVSPQLLVAVVVELTPWLELTGHLVVVVVLALSPVRAVLAHLELETTVGQDSEATHLLRFLLVVVVELELLEPVGQ
jgi:hypothetical protein